MFRWFQSLIQDAGYAIRSYRRSPGFVFVALLSLTLGIGATSAIFSVIYGVLIAPYPYARPNEIWAPTVRGLDGRGGHGHTVDEYVQMAKLPPFADVMATSFEQVLLTGDFSPEAFGGILLSGNAFNFLGVTPVIGRTIQPSDIRPDGEAEPVVVLSHRLWIRLFQGEADAVGKTLRLNDRPHTIIGVMPPRFGWYGNEGVWLPLATNRRDRLFVNPIARLAPGASRQAAETQLHAFYQGRAKVDPTTFPPNGFTTSLVNYMDITVASGDMRASLRVLLGAVGFLLLIACANVANLQLARATTRAREIAVRASIGATPRRLLRQLLTESVLLSLAGGSAGVLFAFGAIRTIVALMPEFYVPNEARVAINVPVLVVSFIVSVLTGILFGLIPAIQGSRLNFVEGLKASRGTGESSRGGRTRNALVVAEVTLAVVLLVSAGLMVRTFLVLQNVDPGLRAENVLIIGVPLPAAKYTTLERRNQFAEQLLESVEGLPGVEAATIGNGGLPFGGLQSPFTIEGQSTSEQRRMAINLVGADHLKTFGISLRAGRMFDRSEVRRGDRVALVNEAALRFWTAGESPLGARLKLTFLERPSAPALAGNDSAAPLTIIGVIANVRNAGFRDAPVPVALVPYSLVAPLQRGLAVRTSGDPLLLLNPLRAAVRAIDAEQPLGRPVTLSRVLGDQTIQPRFTMALFSAFAGLGLILAAAGIYSVLSFHAARRTQELGVRMALGAPRGHVLAMMMWMGARLVGAGLVVGIGVSLAAARVLRSQLFGVTPSDPLSYVAVAALLGAVALAAAYVPARRASSIDPVVALREE